MIDAKSGNLEFGEEKIVTPSTDLCTIDLMNLGERQKLRGIGNGWNWYDVKNVQIEKDFFNFSFLFKHQTLTSLTLVFQDKPFEFNSGWESWSLEAERNNQKRFEAWLDKELGSERNFDWGTVSSNYNTKSGFSAISIEYT